MARQGVRLNHAGISRILKSAEMAAATRKAAEQVAENVRGMGITVGDVDGGTHEIDLPVTVTTFTTDRAHAVVALAHPAGIAVQAKHGALTKGASMAGLEVTSRDQ